LTSSVPSLNDVQATYVATMVDDWIRAGLRDAVICPGSRSTPLAVALHARAEVRCHVRIDERSAAFFAIGRALATKTPVLVVVTSGTAVAELHAAVCEADQAAVPLIVATADRPPRLHGVGAPQTIDQEELFGIAVRASENPGVAQWELRHHWRELASRVWLGARGGTHRPGPVHLNLAFEEPLLGTVREMPEGRPDGRPWQSPVDDHPTAGHVELAGRKVLCVVGQSVPEDVVTTARELDWAVVGDATQRGAIPYADPILRHETTAHALRPDVVVRLGGIPASKVIAQRLATWGVEIIGFEDCGFLADPDRVITRRVPGRPHEHQSDLVGQRDYVEQWLHLANVAHDVLLAERELSEPMLAHLVVQLANERDTSLVVGSSMPVRDVEWFGPTRTSPTFSNRGVNGIDGVVSTIFGVAATSHAIGFVGDITFLHDVSGLVDGVGGHGGSAVVVVADNQGGGIFSFLPQSQALATDVFEPLFGTPRPLDIVAIADAFGHHGVRATSLADVRREVEAALGRPGVSVIVAPMPTRRDNVDIHARIISTMHERFEAHTL
jgi:2-succinyl-5-enolpyruvyl-6-hydroxy-3-cyclohexene-1-carboxylate synthase